MSKPTSSVSTAISIRIPNDLLQSVIDYAQSQGFINESGRTDKRGQPNLSAAISDLLKQALNQDDQSAQVSGAILTLSDSVIHLKQEDLEASITAIENRLVDRVCDAVTRQLDTLLVGQNTANNVVNLDNQLKQTVKQDTCSTQQKDNTRKRILNAVSRGFRSRGYNGIGVDTLAKEAGVTSGAFYGYFRSKEEAFLAAVVTGVDEYRAGVEKFRANHGDDWVVALAEYYVGHKHRDDLVCGCALPTLSPEVIRSNSRVRSAYQTELIKLNEAIAAGLTTGTDTEKQHQAWVLLSLLTGGVTLARAVWDQTVAEQVAKAVRQAAVAIKVYTCCKSI